ncbi:hypothetical protein DPMN_146443 [Dreissena polymorpha]|uniref:Uncharacterized protein n=1 Tax=Dreissena polymorpha TaxID=45954 RepID=A0A9D4FAB5_DREPO|nr:hypothetical protein DPMN_146443 [Dreissena polymorpha]
MYFLNHALPAAATATGCFWRSEACFSGKHTGQSCRKQFLQWVIICWISLRFSGSADWGWAPCAWEPAAP